MKGDDFAERLLYIKWRDDDSYYGAASAWVGDCPDGVEPRSLENPHVYSYGETLEDEWGGGPGETWYIVGARGETNWIGIDLDVGDEHAETVDFELYDVSFPEEGCLVASTPSGGIHMYVLVDDVPLNIETLFDGVDLLSDSGAVRLAGAVSPWHDPDREIVKDAEPSVFRTVDWGENRGFERMFSVGGRPILTEREIGGAVVDLEIPDDAPDDVPECIGKLLRIRSSELRYEYPDSPFAVDTHLGMMLCAVGYPLEDAVSLMGEYPPAKQGGFDEGETRNQLSRLWGKMHSGDLSPPVQKLAEAGIDGSRCSCLVHGAPDRGRTVFPRASSERSPRRADHVELERAKQDVRRTLGQGLGGGMIYHAPQGLGKTRYAVHGAREHPRTIITTNKGEHRDSIRYFAGEAGVSVAEVIPFSESWLCSPESPVADECLSLYARGAQPKWITDHYGDLVPEDAECRYLEQFEGPAPSVDLLMASPGHENVPRFRQYDRGPDEDPGPREIIWDDVNPADHEIDKNTFALDSARAEINELLQEIDEIPADSVSELQGDPTSIDLVERIAIGGAGGGDEEGEANDDPRDVWEALEAAAVEDGAIRIDIVDVMRKRSSVKGDTIIKLKVVAGSEIRGVRTLSWTGSDDAALFSWVSHPDLSDHDVAVISATHVPHVTEEWFSLVGAGPAEHRSAARDWIAVRRAQGYLLVQTSGHRNSRSGAGSHHDDPGKRRESMRRRRDDLVDAIADAEGERPTMIDSLGLLEPADDGVNFARVWSNNELRDERVGFVAGSTYFRDEWVEARAAYCGVDAEILHPDGLPARATDDLAQDLLEYMTKAWVEQAATRFGRSSDVPEVKVYVDTREIPPGFPTIDISDRIVRITDTQKDAYEAVAGGASTIEEVSKHTDVTRRQTGNALWGLEEAGLIEIERFALEDGKHEAVVSGSGGISINTVLLPEIEPDAAGMDAFIGRLADSDEDGDGSGTIQTSIETFGPPPD